MAKVRTYVLALGTACLISFAVICFEFHEIHKLSPAADEDPTSNLQVSQFLQTKVAEQSIEHSTEQSTRLLPPFPTPPRIQHRHCQRMEQGVSGLPNIAMVIPYLHEKWEPMKATVASIIAFTPAELLDVILFIDDGNDPSWEFHEGLKAIHSKVMVHRNPTRVGLIKSKVIGAGLTNSPVIMFMEPHCIVNRQWLEPLLRQMVAAGPSHNTVVTPTLDIIPEKNFNGYDVAGQFIGGFDWNLNFNWMALVSERNKSWREPEPYPSPALSGGIFAIWRDFWEHTGTYDEAMKEWGAEHVEMSLRLWRCGGRIEMVPCSRIGHMFRSASPYTRHAQAMFTNSRRVAEVWLDDYKEDFYRGSGHTKDYDMGDITDRLKLKDELKCKSMDWYLENVYPELQKTSRVWQNKHGADSKKDA